MPYSPLWGVSTLILSRREQVAFLFLSILILVLCSGSIGVCSQQSLDFIYIDSSVDDAAGGHTALRFGQTVFHYQYYTDGYFTLVKDDWDKFRYQYNDLQNRTLAIASLRLSSEVYQKIKTRFLTRYLLQQKRFAYLAKVKTEEEFFRDLAAGRGAVSIKGLGFFSVDRKDDALARVLREYIVQRFGTSYLDDQLRKIETRLNNARQNLQPELIENIELSPYLPALSFPVKSQEYFELSALHEAISVLLYCRPVLSRMLYQAPSDIGRLGQTDLVRLQQYRERICLSIMNLLESSRPGRGTAILVQAARFQALTLSINIGEMVTLDPFSENAELVRVENLISVPVPMQNGTTGSPTVPVVKEKRENISRRTYFEQIRYVRLRNAQGASGYFFSAREDVDIAYNQLEAHLGRLWEIDHIGKSKSKMRIEAGPLLPGRSRQIQNSISIEPQALSHFVEITRINISLLEKEFLRVYGYNLFDKNCVTELFEAVYSTFPTIDQAEQELGGYLQPGEYFSFVPFRAFQLIQQYFPITAIEILPSFRKRTLDKLYEQRGPVALLTESNTLTSEIYSSWEEDSTFLFFTDDTLVWRPVFGALNLLYATSGSLGGIFSFPVDGGSLLRRSLRGMIFSLPELAFFNIRKGTFPAVAYE